MLYYLRYYTKQIIPHFESFLLYRKFRRNFLIKQKKIFPYKMRSAQTHLCAWAIMKKFIYVCNEKHYMFPLLCIYSTIQL